MTNPSAEILEALGKHDAAANLRWREQREETIDGLTIEELEAQLEQCREFAAGVARLVDGADENKLREELQMLLAEHWELAE